MKKIGEKAWAVSGLIWWTARLCGMPAVAALEKQRFLVEYHQEINRGIEAGRLRRSQKGGKWVWGWSEQIDLRMRGEKDPVAAWSEEWRGEWCLFCFDLPRQRAKTRMRLLRTLRKLGFGHLQGSLWVSPREDTELAHLMEVIEISPNELSIFRANTLFGMSDNEIAQQAWSWNAVGQKYEEYLVELKQLQREVTAITEVDHAVALIHKEAKYWLKAIEGDPLLPMELEVEEYLGQEAWRRRENFIRQALRKAGIH